MVKPVLVDTDILSMFFRNNLNVASHFREYLNQHEKVNLSIITFYEILSGLRFKGALKQLNSFLEFTKNNTILPLTEDSTIISSDLYADLRKTGRLIDDIDLLIAGIALSNRLVLVTHNEKHFKRIKGLEVMNWSKEKAGR